MAQIDNEFIFIVFSQTILCLLSTIPYCAETIFHILHQTNKTDSHKQSILSELIRLISYLNFSLTFYTNFYSSKIFRQLARKVLRNLFKSKQIISTQITIINHHQETHQTQLTIRPSRTVNITHVAIISKENLLSERVNLFRLYMFKNKRKTMKSNIWYIFTQKICLFTLFASNKNPVGFYVFFLLTREISFTHREKRDKSKKI